jgi:hypothetical protein
MIVVMHALKKNGFKSNGEAQRLLSKDKASVLDIVNSSCNCDFS